MLSFMLSACGPCGVMKHIDLKTVSQEQLTTDMALFKKHWYPEVGFGFEVSLEELNQHRDLAAALFAIGYVRRHGKHFELTPRGRAVSGASGDREHPPYFFLVDEAHRKEPTKFTFETEGHHCDLERSLERVYWFDVHVGRLTKLGQLLLRRGLLYRGSNDVNALETAVPARGSNERVHERFSFWPGAAAEATVNFGGEGVGLKWQLENNAKVGNVWQ